MTQIETSWNMSYSQRDLGKLTGTEVIKLARKPRPTQGNKDPEVMGEKSVNPMGVSPDHEFSVDPLSKGAAAAKRKNTR